MKVNGLLCGEWVGRGRSGHGETNEETIAAFSVRGNVCLHQDGGRLQSGGKTKGLFWRKNDWIC